MTPPLLTFTGNLLAERTHEFAAWAPGRTQRATRTSFQVGGKGINVAKMLRRLGTPVTALAFAGGPAGDECRAWLTQHGFTCELFTTQVATRSGLVVRAPGQPETTFLGPDAAPEAAAWQAAATYLEAQPAFPGTTLAICGSAPGWASAAAAPWRTALIHWQQLGHQIVVDSYGPPLAELVAQSVALIKINADELRALLGDHATDDTPANLAVARARWARTTWVISDGPGPVWLAEPDAPLVQLTPPSIVEVSPTGSGDVLLAAMLHARLARGASWPEALAFALPYAAANAAHPGIAEFPSFYDLFTGSTP